MYEDEGLHEERWRQDYRTKCGIKQSKNPAKHEDRLTDWQEGYSLKNIKRHLELRQIHIGDIKKVKMKKCKLKEGY